MIILQGLRMLVTQSDPSTRRVEFGLQSAQRTALVREGIRIPQTAAESGKRLQCCLDLEVLSLVFAELLTLRSTGIKPCFSVDARTLELNRAFRFRDMQS